MLTSEQYKELILRLDTVIRLLELMNAPKVASVSVGTPIAVERGLPSHHMIGTPVQALSPDYRQQFAPFIRPDNDNG